MFNYLSMSFTPQFMWYDSISTLLQYCSIRIGNIWYFVVFFLQMKILHCPGWSLLILYSWGISRNETLVPVIVDLKIPHKLIDIFCCFIFFFVFCGSLEIYRVKRLITSEGAKTRIGDDITVILKYLWQMTIARTEDIYKDYSCISILFNIFSFRKLFGTF